MKKTVFSVDRTGNIRRGNAAPLIVFGVAAFCLLAAGAWYYLKQPASESEGDFIFAEVEKGEFVSQVLDQGEVQSSENVEIRCEVSARSGSLSVIEVCPEGTRVGPGDFLVRLDSSTFEKELQQQKIKVATAQTAKIQSKAAVDAAEATKREYIKGVFVEGMKQIENEIFDAQSEIETAQQELRQAESVYEHTKKLLSKGYVTKQQLAAEEFAVKKARLALSKGENSRELALTKKMVLEDITYQKQIVQLDSDIEASKVKYNNEIGSLAVEEEEQREIERQIKKCVITVPEGVEGQVVYAKESSRGGNDWVLEEGTSVRERQVLIRLPNPDMMEVKALINEQSITQIEIGMPVSVIVDALSGQQLKGVVTKVNQYAESNGWMSSSIRKYAVFVKIFDPPEALKPGMNASVNIQVKYVEDALTAPLQTVYSVQDRFFCLVKMGNGFQTREVKLAGNNTRMVLIEEGVQPGEQLVMNPGAHKELLDLPEVQHNSRIEIDEEKLKLATAESGQDATAQNGPPRGGAGGGGRPGGGGGRPGGGGGGPGGGGFSVDSIVDRILSSGDTNGDGKIDATEIPNLDERMKSRVDEYDSNGDGELVREELKKGMEAMMKRFQNSGGPGGG